MGWAKVLGLAVLATAILLFILHRWMDSYRWENPIIAEMQKQGFEPISEPVDSDAFFPRPLFYPQVKQVTLANPATIRRFKGFIAADVLSFSKEESGKVISRPSILLFDCAANLVAYLADSQGSYENRILRPDGVQIRQWWFEMNEAMNTYFCKKFIIKK
ncbi:MAG: hypothetical protein WCH75_24335 [Candidatus Binatia bacterium]